ncbi:MAG: hypothetical protein AAGF71_14290 [Pseudomonadota bacterium]
MNRKALEKLYSLHANSLGQPLPKLELVHLQKRITRHTPKRFLEVGTGSGFTGGFICNFLDDCEAEVFHTIDEDTEFYGDRSKPVGHMLRTLYDGDDVDVKIEGGTTVLDLPKNMDPFDMVFLDGNRQHPWPLLDALLLAPRLRGPKEILMSNLLLYQLPNDFHSIGPKILFDQLPPTHRGIDNSSGKNMFAASMKIPEQNLETIAVTGFTIPWTLLDPLTEEQLEKAAAALRWHYGAKTARIFKEAAERFNWIRVPRVKRARHKIRTTLHGFAGLPEPKLKH